MLRYMLQKKQDVIALKLRSNNVGSKKLRNFFKKTVVFISALLALVLIIYRLSFEYNLVQGVQYNVYLIHNEIPHALTIFAITTNSYYWLKLSKFSNKLAWIAACLLPLIIAVVLELIQGWQTDEAVKDLLRSFYGYIPGLLFNFYLKI